MNTASEKGGDSTSKVVHMYPNNQLKSQVRDFGETLSAFNVIADAARA